MRPLSHQISSLEVTLCQLPACHWNIIGDFLITEDFSQIICPACFKEDEWCWSVNPETVLRVLQTQLQGSIINQKLEWPLTHLFLLHDSFPTVGPIQRISIILLTFLCHPLNLSWSPCKKFYKLGVTCRVSVASICICLDCTAFTESKLLHCVYYIINQCYVS